MTPEDADLIEDQFPALNSQFYGANPSDYFKRRLHLLVVAAGASDDLSQLLADGVRYKGIVAQLGLPQNDTEDERERKAFVSTEAEVLLHHVSEALLRLYFAHADQPQCPWLECARLRQFPRFKKMVEEFHAQAPSEATRRQIGHVFLGGVPTEDNIQGHSAVAAIERLLKILARRLLDDSHLYNAAKHGLAVIAGQSRLAVANDAGTTVFDHSGQSLCFLETQGDKDERRWHTTTRWVEARHAMWLTSLAIAELRSLWAVAKWRYTDAELTGVEAVTEEAVDDAIRGDFATRPPVTRFSMKLGYQADLTPSPKTEAAE